MSSPWSPVTPESEAKRRRRRLFWTVAAALLVVASITARPVYRRGKQWRGRSLARQAEAFTAARQWKDAAAKAQAAFQLAPEDPASLRAMAHLHSALSYPAALGYWRALLATSSATSADHRDALRFAIRADQFEFAEQQFAAALKDHPDDRETLELGAQLALRKGDRTQALGLTGRILSRDPNDREALLERAQILFTSAEPPQREEGRASLLRLGQGNDAAALRALGLLANDATLPPTDAESVANALDSHPAAALPDRLAAVSVRLRLHPELRDGLVEQTLAQWGGSQPDALAVLGRWTLQHGSPERVLGLISPPAALTSQDLFLVRADALAALGRWEEIQRVLEGNKTPLDATYIEIFLARAAQELKQDRSAEGHWLAALSAATKSPPQNFYLAQYAERAGNRAIAVKAWRQMARHPGWALRANLAMVPLLEETGSTRALRDVVGEIARLVPKDPTPRNDAAYLDLLLGENLPASTKTALELFQSQPEVLAYRTTLALAYLKTGSRPAARQLYEGVNLPWTEALPRFQAIRSAALADPENAPSDSLPPALLKRLLPEELALVERVN